MNRIVSWMRVLAMAAATVAFFATAALAVPRAGAPAPSFSMNAIANSTGTLTLDRFKGKGVYLNFFASWCLPCKAEVPSIAKLSKTYAKKGVVVIGVDEFESVNVAQAFVTKFNLPYAIGADNSGTVGASYGLIGMPLHVFIGADGKIALRRDGELTADQIRAGLDQIARR